jgi:ankyrin repeat protein
MLQRAAGGAFGNVQPNFTSKHGGNEERMKEILSQAWKQCDNASTIIELLIDSGADVNACGGQYYMALNAAALAGRQAIVELLIRRGANVNISAPAAKPSLADEAGENCSTAFEYALSMGHEEVAKYLLNQKKFDAEINIIRGMALHLAAEKCPSMVRDILDKGCQTDGHDEHGKTPLHCAMKAGHLDAARALIEAGADVCAVGHTYSRKEPLQCMQQFDNPELVRLLLENGASVRSQTATLKNLLLSLFPNTDSYHEGVDMDTTVQIMQMLITGGADVNSGQDWDPNLAKASYTVDNYRPLLLLIERGQEEIAFYHQLLNSSRFDLEIQGTNALWYAVRRNLQPVVKMLLGKGAVVTADIIDDAKSRLDEELYWRSSWDATKKQIDVRTQKWQEDKRQILKQLGLAFSSHYVN